MAARSSSDPLVRIDIRVELPPSLVAGTEGDTNLEKIEIPPDHEPPPSSVAGTEGDTDWERQPSEEQEQQEEQEEQPSEEQEEREDQEEQEQEDQPSEESPLPDLSPPPCWYLEGEQQEEQKQLLPELPRLRPPSPRRLGLRRVRLWRKTPQADQISGGAR